MEKHPRKNLPKEIERKFLINKLDPFAEFLLNSSGFRRANIRQGYLSNDEDKVIRIRSVKNYGTLGHDDLISREIFLTVKGKQEGLSKTEVEVPIAIGPLNLDSIENLFEMCEGNIIEKTRFKIPYHPAPKDMSEEEYDRLRAMNLQWEIDIFDGDNSGLILVEIELPSEDVEIDIPSWVGEEVSTDFNYSNSYLAQHPFTSWGA